MARSVTPSLFITSLISGSRIRFARQSSSPDPARTVTSNVV
jgi:hypothetical protein